MKQSELKKGRRYWFRNYNIIYSGLYDGMENERLAKIVKKRRCVAYTAKIYIYNKKRAYW